MPTYDAPLLMVIVFTVVILAAVSGQIRSSATTSPTDWWSAVLAISGVFAAIFAAFTLSAIRGQLDEMQAEQRPWIYADTPIIESPIEQNQNGAWLFSFKFDVHNTGHTPAMYVWQAVKVIVSTDFDEFTKTQKEVCGQNNDVVPNDLGDAVFPGQSIVRRFTYGVLAGDWRQAAIKGRGAVSPKIFGCFVYQFPSSSIQHKTGFAYNIGLALTPPENGVWFLPSDPSKLPIEKLGAYPWNWKNAFDAD